MVISRKVIALVISAVALLVCLATMVGGTFATNATTLTYYNDTGLEFNLSYLTKDNSIIIKEDDTLSLFSGNWEPGRMETARLKVENKGTLPFDFWIYPHAEPVEVGKADLASVIDVYMYKGNYSGDTRPDLTSDEWVSLGTLRSISNNIAGWNSSNDPDVNTHSAHGQVSAENTNSDADAQMVTLLLRMQESAGNEYKNASADVKLTLYAKSSTASTT